MVKINRKIGWQDNFRYSGNYSEYKCIRFILKERDIREIEKKKMQGGEEVLGRN